MNKKTALILILGTISCLFSIFLKNPPSKSQLVLHGSYFEPIHIIDFESEVPCIELKIEDTRILAKIALGFNGQLSLPGSYLEKLTHKTFLHEVFYSGINGEKYRTSLYTIPEIQTDRLNLYNAESAEDKSSSERLVVGKIGWSFFEHLNFFLDCNLWLIAISDSLETLSQRGYSIQSFVECPFLLNRKFIEFEAITEKGPLRCLLDTGTTNNLINTKTLQNSGLNSESSYCFQNFKIGSRDFGKVSFHAIDSLSEFDLIIGMEFLHSKQLFVDFPNRKLYLSDARD